jgi:hypothetical protein
VSIPSRRHRSGPSTIPTRLFHHSRPGGLRRLLVESVRRGGPVRRGLAGDGLTIRWRSDVAGLRPHQRTVPRFGVCAVHRSFGLQIPGQLVHRDGRDWCCPGHPISGPTHISFFEPNIFFNWGRPTGLTKPPASVGEVGLSFHDQCEERAVWEAGGGTTQPTPAQEAACLKEANAPQYQAARTTQTMAGPVHD